MLHKLFAFSERYYAGDGVLSIEDTIAHLPSFIQAFASVISELSSLDASYIHHLERVLGALFLIFPQLFPAQRENVYAVLGDLLVVLYSKGGALKTLLSRVGAYQIFTLLFPLKL